MITVAQNTDKFKWAGVPWIKRYATSVSAPESLLEEMHKIDELLDLKFYLPTQKWHVVRWANGFGNPFVKVWECREDPNYGTHEGLGDWIIGALHAGDMQGAAKNRIQEIDDWNQKIEDAAQRELSEQAKDTAKDLCKVYSNWHDYGPDSETHLVYPVGADIKSVEKK
jgi:hypothetical protein